MKRNLQKLFEDAGLNVRSYSGRGMYGKDCLGVVVPSVGSLLSGLFEELAVNNDIDFEEFTKGFRDMQTDNMGMDMIVYFPNISFEDDDE